jgi:hypothetical protein
LKYLALVVALAAATPAHADTDFYRFETGIELSHLCDGDGATLDPSHSISACGGYVEGVMGCTYGLQGKQ